jgi:hypothetical protein
MHKVYGQIIPSDIVLYTLVFMSRGLSLRFRLFLFCFSQTTQALGYLSCGFDERR